MKTETQIAQGNIENAENKGFPFNVMLLYKVRCEEHKSSCERVLGFLEALTKWRSWEGMSIFAKQNVKDRIADLKNAIKLYEGAGI